MTMYEILSLCANFSAAAGSFFAAFTALHIAKKNINLQVRENLRINIYYVVKDESDSYITYAEGTLESAYLLIRIINYGLRRSYIDKLWLNLNNTRIIVPNEEYSMNEKMLYINPGQVLKIYLPIKYLLFMINDMIGRHKLYDLDASITINTIFNESFTSKLSSIESEIIKSLLNSIN